MQATAITIITLLLGVGAYAQEWQVERCNYINWFKIKRFIPGERDRILTTNGNMYIRSEAGASWEKDPDYENMLLKNIYYSSKWTLICPQNVLTDTETGQRHVTSEKISAMTIQCANMKGDTLILGVKDSIVLVNLKNNRIIKKVPVSAAVNDDCEIYCNDKCIILRAFKIFVYNYNLDRVRVYNEAPPIGEYSQTQNITQCYKLPLCADGKVLVYDSKRDAMTDVYVAEWGQEEIRSMMMAGDSVYFAVENINELTVNIYVFDVEDMSIAKVSEDSSYQRIGRGQCCIHGKKGDIMITSSIYGGCNKYLLTEDAVMWYGNGIYEPHVRACAAAEWGISAWYLYAIDEYDHYSHATNTDADIFVPDGQDIEVYKERIVTNVGGYLVMHSRDGSSADIMLAGPVSDYDVYNGTTLYYSGIPGTFMYNGNTKLIEYTSMAQIEAADGMLYIYDNEHILKVYDISSGSAKDYQVMQHERSHMVAANRRIAVFNTASGLYGYDYIDSTTRWHVEMSTGFVKSVTMHGNLYIVTGSGRVVDALTGETAVSLMPGVCQAVVSRDSCFVFYRNGATYKIYRNLLNNVEDRWRTPATINTQSYPTPSKMYVCISININDHSPCVVSIYGPTGACVERIVSNWEYQDDRRIYWYPYGYPNGAYYYTVETMNEYGEGKIILSR